jgi:hypothetical protein
MITGSQNVMAPVAETPNSASEPCPSCQNQVMAPNTAASDIRLSSTALIGSSSDRNVRTSSTKVITAISAST